MRQADRSREVVRPNYLVDCPTRVAVVDPMLAEWGIGEGLGQRVALPILVVDRPMRVGVAQAILFAVVVWSAGDSLPVGWLAAPNHRRLPDVMMGVVARPNRTADRPRPVRRRGTCPSLPPDPLPAAGHPPRRRSNWQGRVPRQAAVVVGATIHS